MGNRFVVVDGSLSAHCCFDATVIDTDASSEYDRTVCECFDRKWAEAVALALNEESS